MAKNGAKGGGRVGLITGRTQFQNGDTWFKRDRTTGQIIGGKADEKPFKSVAKEPDKRRD
jgi:hypothetical protein